MPELAEVEFYRNQWNPALRQQVTALTVNSRSCVFQADSARQLLKQLPGTALQQSFRHGKQLLFLFDQTHWLSLHLGMTGALRAESSSNTDLPHDHLCLRFHKICLIFSDPRQFGRIRYEESPHTPAWWTALPPEPLDPGFSIESLALFFQRHRRLPLKAALLLQAQFPGIGNWMADEILWRSRLHPRLNCGRLTPQEIRRLWSRTRQVCRDALRVIGTNWSDPPDTWLFNHRWRDGGRCPKTGVLLKRESIGGRTTCWSPAWQNPHS